jgi:hypothetical protein
LSGGSPGVLERAVRAKDERMSVVEHQLLTADTVEEGTACLWQIRDWLRETSRAAHNPEYLKGLTHTDSGI